jgi:hypothetical protein
MRADLIVGFLRQFRGRFSGTGMKLTLIIVAVAIVLPIAPLMAAEGPNKDTATLEAQYQACLALQRLQEQRVHRCGDG